MSETAQFFFAAKYDMYVYLIFLEKIIKCKRLQMQRIQQNFLWSFLYVVKENPTSIYCGEMLQNDLIEHNFDKVIQKISR